MSKGSRLDRLLAPLIFELKQVAFLMKIAFEHHLKERPGVSMGVSLRARRQKAERARYGFSYHPDPDRPQLT